MLESTLIPKFATSILMTEALRWMPIIRGITFRTFALLNGEVRGLVFFPKDSYLSPKEFLLGELDGWEPFPFRSDDDADFSEFHHLVVTYRDDGFVTSRIS